MTKYNIFIDAVIERRETNTLTEPVFLIIDTQLDKKFLEDN